MRALIIVGQYVQDHEFIYPYYRLKARGFEVDVATKDGKECKGYYGTKIPVDLDFKGMRAVDNDFPYDILVIPGGAKCMEYLRQEKEVLDFIRNFNDTDRIIASICHGAQLLISAKIVKGREVSGYYSIRDDIENAGAEYASNPYSVDKNLVTCPHYKYLGEWMEKVIEIWEKKTIEENNSK